MIETVTNFSCLAHPGALLVLRDFSYDEGVSPGTYANYICKTCEEERARGLIDDDLYYDRLVDNEETVI